MFDWLTSMFGQELTIERVGLTLIFAFIIGVIIYLVYKRTFGGVMYSRNFNLSLIIMTLVTALIIMPITSNLTLSLGMVGALSIVRFRTAVKDPMDVIFLFWAIAEGITLGAGILLVAVIGVIVISILILILSVIKFKATTPFLLVIHYDEMAAGQVKGLLKQLPDGKLKSRTVSRRGMEITIELRMRESDAPIIDKFLAIEGVHDATLMTYQGNIIS